MHIIIGTLIAIAGLIFWLGRAAQGAREISDTVHDIKNMPRRRRFKKNASQEGLDLIKNPVDAATILMIAVARLDDDGRVSEAENLTITQHLTDGMDLPRDAADEKLFHLRWLSRSLLQPGSALFPMCQILQNTINKGEARDLARMLQSVAKTDGDMNPDQKEFIRCFQDSLGLLG